MVLLGVGLHQKVGGTRRLGHVTAQGQENWEMFVAIPAESQSIAPILNREIIHALTEAGIIDQTKIARAKCRT